MTMKALITSVSTRGISTASLSRAGAHAPAPREWLYGGSGKRAAAVATAAGMAVFGAGVVLGSTVLGRRRPKAVLVLTDVLSGVLAGTLVFDALRHARKQRAALLHRDAIILQMNHHVRNALQSIALATHASPDTQPAIHAAIERIQWALREVLPQDSWR
jgi:hypothetical protein